MIDEVKPKMFLYYIFYIILETFPLTTMMNCLYIFDTSIQPSVYLKGKWTGRESHFVCSRYPILEMSVHGVLFYACVSPVSFYQILNICRKSNHRLLFLNCFRLKWILMAFGMLHMYLNRRSSESHTCLHKCVHGIRAVGTNCVRMISESTTPINKIFYLWILQVARGSFDNIIRR